MMDKDVLCSVAPAGIFSGEESRATRGGLITGSEGRDRERLAKIF